MNRRDFMASATSAAAVPVLAGIQDEKGGAAKPFRLDYAPHFGMFEHLAGRDLASQIDFMADHGFRSIEDNGMAGRPVEDQERIRKALDRHGMRMGVFVAHAEWSKPSFANPGMRGELVRQMKAAVEVAKRVGARWCTVVPGRNDARTEPDFQSAAVVDNLRACAEVCDPAGLVMVLEPLNPWTNHPGMFLSKIAHAYLLCRGVDSPSCKILFDIYHQQITEGNLIPNITRAWDEIGYFQVGDNPGRCEPGTGEINFATVFRHIHGRGFTGIVGMEHGKSRRGKDGEQAVIDAYRAADPV